MLFDVYEELDMSHSRRHCPDPQEIGEYDLGLLDGPQAIWMRNHLRSCAACKQELDRLHVFLDATANDIPGDEPVQRRPKRPRLWRLSGLLLGLLALGAALLYTLSLL